MSKRKPPHSDEILRDLELSMEEARLKTSSSPTRLTSSETGFDQKDVQAAIQAGGKSRSDLAHFMQIMEKRLTSEQFKEFTIRFEKASGFAKNSSALMNAVKKDLVNSMMQSVQSLSGALLNSFKGIDWKRGQEEIEAYGALCSYLDLAIDDLKVQKSAKLVELTRYFRNQLGLMSFGQGEDDFRSIVGGQQAKKLISQTASKNAKSKNLAARTWALSEWPKYKAKKWSKARFSKWCQDNKPSSISEQLPKAEQIARVWLKGK
jgi:hypothetical protein